MSRSWYYEHHHTVPQAKRDLALRDAIERLVLAFPGYGYRRVTMALARAGWSVNHNRVVRVTRQESLLCLLKRRVVVTTDAAHGRPAYPNLLRDQLVERRGTRVRVQVWVADMTYIRLPTAFVYLACILDAYSRRCIGWELSPTIDTRLTLAAFDRALALRQPAPGLIHHSDRGVQYASSAYIARLEQHETRISMSARSNPYDNATAESFFSTLKREEVSLQHIARSTRPRPTLAGSSTTSTTTNGSIRASAICHPWSSRQPTPSIGKPTFDAGPVNGVHPISRTGAS